METGRSSTVTNVIALLLLVGALFAKLFVLGYFILRHQTTPHEVGFALGRTLPGGAAAVLVGLVVYLVSKRSNIAAASAFAVIMMISVVVDLRFAGSQRRDGSLAKIDATRDEMLGELESSINKGELPQGNVERLEKMSKDLGSAAAASSADERKMLLAGQQLLALIGAPMKSYQAALETLQSAGFVSPNTLQTPQAVEERREMVGKFGAANQKLLEFFENIETTAREELTKQGVPQRHQAQFARGFAKSANVDLNLTIRQCDAELVAEMTEMLDLLAGSKGPWKLDEDRAMFSTPAALHDFEEIQKRMTESARRQSDAQKELLARGRKQQAKEPVRR